MSVPRDGGHRNAAIEAVCLEGSHRCVDFNSFPLSRGHQIEGAQKPSSSIESTQLMVYVCQLHDVAMLARGSIRMAA